jgi:hypothetical protein
MSLRDRPVRTDAPRSLQDSDRRRLRGDQFNFVFARQNLTAFVKQAESCAGGCVFRLSPIEEAALLCDRLLL